MVLSSAFGATYPASGQAPAPAAASSIPADPWPRVVDLYRRAGAGLPAAGQQVGRQPARLPRRAGVQAGQARRTRRSASIFATARTQVDKVARTVVFEDMQISKIDFPTLPDRGASYVAELHEGVRGEGAHDRARPARGVARRRRRQAAGGRGANNAPPQVIVSNSPAILVPIDGAPVMKPVPEQRALPARHQHARADPAGRPRATASTSTSTTAGCRRSSLDGPVDAGVPPAVRHATTRRDRSSRRPARSTCSTADPKANPKPSLANGVPTIYTSQAPTELIVFKGQPDFVPIVGTQLLWASNTTSDVLIDTTNNNYYVLLAGRWFRAAGAHRAVDVRRRATRCRRTSRRFRRIRSPAPCCRRSRARRRRRKR